jgi:hypothetical protein
MDNISRVSNNYIEFRCEQVLLYSETRYLIVEWYKHARNFLIKKA